MKTLDDVRALLEGLRHEDTLDTPSLHSKSGTSRAHRSWSSQLGMRRLWHLRGVHEPALRAALASLEGLAGTEALALRGRVRRLLGDLTPAFAELVEAEALLDPYATGWRAELILERHPVDAAACLQHAFEGRPRWPEGRLWQAAAALANRSPDAAREALDAAADDAAALGRPLSALAELLRSQAGLDAGRAREALEAASRAVAAEPQTAAGYLLQAQSYVALGEVDEADAAYHRARDREPELAGFHSLLPEGQMRTSWAHPAEYLRALDQAVALHPHMASLYAERAEVRREPSLCQYTGAYEDYAKAAELAPHAAWVVAYLGRAIGYARGPVAALETMERALRLSGEGSGWIRAWRGESRRHSGDSAGALADFDHCVAVMPWYSFAHSWRGAHLRTLGRLEESSVELDTAVRLDASYVFSRYERFQTRRALGDWRGAVEDLDHAHGIDPKYGWLGKSVRRSAGASDVKALAELDAAAAAHPDDGRFLAWRGYSRLQLSEPETARRDLEAAVGLRPDDARARAWLGWAFKDSGEPERAVAELEASAALAPMDWSPWSLLAEIHAQRGDFQRALDAISRVAVLAPTTASVHYRRASLAHALGNAAEARRDALKAVELDTRYADAHLLLAQIHLAGGDPAAAAASVEKAMAAREPGGTDFLIRALVRQAQGDLAGQVEDFKAALAKAPELFSAESRRQVEALIGGADGR